MVSPTVIFENTMPCAVASVPMGQTYMVVGAVTNGVTELLRLIKFSC